MKSVLDKYLNHILRLRLRVYTHNRSKGIAYYTAAAETVQALMDAPKPAWVDLRFEKK